MTATSQSAGVSIGTPVGAHPVAQGGQLVEQGGRSVGAAVAVLEGPKRPVLAQHPADSLDHFELGAPDIDLDRRGAEAGGDRGIEQRRVHGDLLVGSRRLPLI
ncbi:hypothetical protein FB382_000109 [Nocardioides ginsengisegetis]|uniref:Uncharacterized protein n=1 Tax=Nocardioides ginsengisegetis TaxID=661491 RepID=A0A7W3IWD7_9ACTN|nr:hypothetical protein [Nocardioides ginsengisegetis]MBA8801818.1 hypothetical protein [Nocardioides ginsengisegetis]